MNTEQLLKAVKEIKRTVPHWDKEMGELADKHVSPDAHLYNGVIHVSAEDGGNFANYYGQYDGLDGKDWPWICDELEEFAKKHKMHWDWRDPGCICLYE